MKDQTFLIGIKNGWGRGVIAILFFFHIIFNINSRN